MSTRDPGGDDWKLAGTILLASIPQETTVDNKSCNPFGGPRLFVLAGLIDLYFRCW